MNRPLLSILCITYNHEKYISAALDSFFAQQTDFLFEVVIGEDCSNDGTRLIVDRYKSIYPDRINVITSPINVGFVENFRRTMKACKGKYIAICEGDDYWVGKNKLQVQVDFLESNSEFVIAFHDAYPLINGTIVHSPQLPVGLQRDASSLDLIGARPISTLTACFRNVITDIPKMFNSTPILDLCIWSMLGAYGRGKYMYSIEASVYRVHEGGVFSSQASETKSRMTMQTYLLLAEYYRQRGLPEYENLFMFKAACQVRGHLTKPAILKVMALLADTFLGRPAMTLRKFFFGG